MTYESLNNIASRNGIALVVEFIPTLCSGQALSLPKDSLAMTGGGRSSLLNIAPLPGHCEAISYSGKVC